MDPKLYKTLKQLIKLGILTKNTKVVRRRRKRNGKTAQSSRSVYRIQNPAQTGNVQQHSTPTVQSEQAVVNLKASELQLQKALQNKDLPDDSKQKVILAIEDIKNQIAEQRNVTKNAYYNLDYRIMGVKHDASKQYDISEPTRKSSYSQFVPQTKSNVGMSNNMGLLGNTPYVPPTANDWIHYNEEKDDKVNIPKSKQESESESEPESGAGLVHPEPEHKEPEPEPEPKPKPKPEPEPEPEIKQKPKSGYHTRKNKLLKLREEYADIAGIEVENVNTKWDSGQLDDAIHGLKIKSLQKQYRDNGGTSKTYLAKSYDNISGLELAVKRLIDNKLNFTD